MSKIPRWLVDMVIVIAIVALLTLLSLGQIAAAVLLMLPLTFLFFADRNNLK
jgi:hypothetical protein